MGKTVGSLREKGPQTGRSFIPLLFVISMDYLSRLMNKTRLFPGFTYQLGCKNIGLTHLMFVDYLMMFCKVDKTTF